MLSLHALTGQHEIWVMLPWSVTLFDSKYLFISYMPLIKLQLAHCYDNISRCITYYPMPLCTSSFSTLQKNQFPIRVPLPPWWVLWINLYPFFILKEKLRYKMKWYTRSTAYSINTVVCESQNLTRVVSFCLMYAEWPCGYCMRMVIEWVVDHWAICLQ